MNGGLWELPRTWKWVCARDIAEIVGGGTPAAHDPSNFDDAGTPWVTPADLSDFNDTYIKRGRRGLSAKGLTSSSARILPAGTVLFSSRAPIGYCVISANPIATNQGFKSLVLRSDVSPEYIRYYLISAIEYIESLASGTTFKEISGTKVGNILVPLPPQAEQRRIVAHVEAFLSRTRRARADIERAVFLAKRLEQAVLRAAFATIEATATWKLLGEISLHITSGSRDWTKYYGQGDAVFVLAGNVRPMAFDPRPIQIVDPPRNTAEAQRTAIEKEDLLITIVGANTGDVCRVPEAVKNYFVCQSLALVRLNNELPARFVELYLNTDGFGRTEIAEAIYGQGRPHLSFADLKALRIPVVEPNAALELIRSLDSALANIHRLSQEAARSMALLSHMEEALLRKAFQGELFVQEPANERAEVFLAHVNHAAQPRRAARRKSSPASRARKIR